MPRSRGGALALFALLASVIGAAGYVTIFPSPRVILGRAVDQFDVSFYCTLFVEFPSDAGTSLCGCVVFSPGVVLSAGHCFQKGSDDADGKEFFSSAHVRLYGQMHPVSAALTRVVNSDVYVHPGHSSSSLRNDIAVFHLPMDSSTAPVNLNERAADWDALGPTDRLNVVGIGRTETGLMAMEYNSKGAIDPLSLGLPRETQLSRRSCLNPVGYGNFNPWTKDTAFDDICAGPMYMRAEDSPDGIAKLYGIVSRGWECGVVGKAVHVDSIFSA
jgi:hypothetical protein